MIDLNNIVEKPKGQRYWVVRASGGDYVDHFRQEGVVAIGHIDKLNISDSREEEIFVPEYRSLKKSIELLETKDGKKRSRRSYTHFNQVKSFISEISVGDLVVTIDGGQLMVGRVIGYPFINSMPIRVVYDEDRNQYTDMPYRLRRKVNWGPRMPRGSLPTAMKRSVTSWLTVFNIDKYWAAIYHLLYPVFQNEGKIYLSAHIRQKEEINSFSISQVFRILTELEVIVRSADHIIENSDFDFESIFNEFSYLGDFHLKTTAEFMSPGTIWSHLGFSDKAGRNILICALLYGAIFGINIPHVLQVDGLLHKEAREKLIDMFMKRLDENGAEKMKDRLKLDVPKFNTTPLEDSYDDAPYDDRLMAAVEKYKKLGDRSS